MIKFSIDLPALTLNSRFETNEFNVDLSSLGIQNNLGYVAYLCLRKIKPNNYESINVQKYALMSSDYNFYISEVELDESYNVKNNDEIAVILGSVFGSLVFIIIIIIICCCCCKKKKKEKSEKKLNPVLAKQKVTPPQPVESQQIHNPYKQQANPNFTFPQNPQNFPQNRNSNPIQQNTGSPNIRPYSHTQPIGPQQFRPSNQMHFGQPVFYPGQNMQNNGGFPNRPSLPVQTNGPNYGGGQFYQVGGIPNPSNYGQNQQDPFSLQPNEEIDLPMYEIDMKKQH